MKKLLIIFIFYYSHIIKGIKSSIAQLVNKIHQLNSSINRINLSYLLMLIGGNLELKF
ncbi:hypothetical protein F909_01158 [Acinetobacter sp. ANC 3929]|nr:hypothetical protein F909_01158 [Acinetobacter sp. ANC 3929]